jgi:glycerophosphoryl diester phosphodiesterase
MPVAPISITFEGWTSRLKWHMGRRRESDLPFTPARLREGLLAGASVEVDLLVHAEAGCALLHDDDLDLETTGRGPVRHATVQMLRQLRLRDGAGAPTEFPVLLLEDLCALLAEVDAKTAPLLQLDYKEETLPSPEVVANFAHLCGPLRGRMILAGGFAPAIEALAQAVPGLATGHDPCFGDSIERLRASGDYTAFIHDALRTAPNARIIYLAIDLLLAADAAGVDLVALCHADGREVDAWTIRSVNEASLAQVRRLMQLKVDQITTDDPEALAAAFGALA